MWAPVAITCGSTSGQDISAPRGETITRYASFFRDPIQRTRPSHRLSHPGVTGPGEMTGCAV